MISPNDRVGIGNIVSLLEDGNKVLQRVKRGEQPRSGAQSTLPPEIFVGRRQA